MISIIIPIYNASQYLQRCLDSLLKQVSDNCEILLVNDGSTDDSKEICEDYAKKFPIVKLYSQTNQGPSAARNLGIEKSSGTFITFVDSDDYVSDDYFVSLEEMALLDNDLAIYAYRIQPSKRDQKLLKEGIFNKSEILKIFHSTVTNSKMLWFPWNKLYKKEIIDKYNIRFSEKIRIGEDTIFNLNYLLHCNNVFFLQKVLYNYVENEASLTQDKSYRGFLLESMENHFSERVKIHQSSLDIQGEKGDKDIASYYIEHILFWLISNAKQSKDRLAELKKIRQSIIYNHTFKNYYYNWNNPKKSLLIKLFELKLYYLLLKLI
ncbi:glycosyltransferase [Epilithonimonas arachidiradicis]|uniref:Glycosyltransferase EpsJ n=1 Tax=Epilithonimonas arachidiradicis TaxID=1617282 RepID=A0A420CIU3_9FLAO|nr:glycosyltransferase [Epilithonimonas arachidiradicis]RKE78377.1 glycosyltransferase EpsJ [Epilithonimonas arachidiradicis]GGG67250.1 putative glycosyltransferase EpsJ [Epilithonimonas arachidiradicis]